MNGRQRKLKTKLDALSRQQLIALAVQKEALPYQIALGQTKDKLVETLVTVNGVLKPEQV